MKKLFGWGLVAGLALLASSALVHAAAEVEVGRDQEKLAAAAMLGWNLHQACADYNFPEIERLLAAGATDIPGCSNLLRAIMSDTVQSATVVRLLVDKGVSVDAVDGVNPLECALRWEQPFKHKKAKLTALLDAGVNIDLDAISKAVTAAQADQERRGSWSKYLLTPEEWRDLCELIVNKVEDDRQLTAILYPLLLETLPVDGPADLVGQYMLSYWDGRNQTREAEAPEAAQELEDGGGNQKAESVQEQKDGE
jgi:hypothetical protein